MNGVRTFNEADAAGRTLPEKGLPPAWTLQVRNRQAAALYLHAAALSDNPATREVLRRRAAELIAPRPGHWGPGVSPRVERATRSPLAHHIAGQVLESLRVVGRYRLSDVG